MGIKQKIAHIFRSILTLISPKLNTRVTYFLKFRRQLDLDNPRTLNEKILWLKFNTYWNNPVVKQCADKYQVRDYITDLGYGEILNELFGVYDDVNLIPWNELPNKFALKLNVGCGFNIIVDDKSNLNIELAKKTLKKWMKSRYYLGYSEMQYKGVKPYILVEKYLGEENGELPVDYKFYCMNGESKYVLLCTDRKAGEKPKFFFMNQAWEMMPYTRDALENPKKKIEKPHGIEQAFAYAEKLSRGFPFVRIDLYIENDKVYFGEYTFTPSGGMDTNRLSITDIEFGKQVILPH